MAGSARVSCVNSSTAGPPAGSSGMTAATASSGRSSSPAAAGPGRPSSSAPAPSPCPAASPGREPSCRHGGDSVAGSARASSSTAGPPVRSSDMTASTTSSGGSSSATAALLPGPGSDATSPYITPLYMYPPRLILWDSAGGACCAPPASRGLSSSASSRLEPPSHQGRSTGSNTPPASVSPRFASSGADAPSSESSPPRRSSCPVPRRSMEHLRVPAKTCLDAARTHGAKVRGRENGDRAGQAAFAQCDSHTVRFERLPA